PAPAFGAQMGKLLNLVAVSAGNRVDRAKFTEAKLQDILLRLQFSRGDSSHLRNRGDYERPLVLAPGRGIQPVNVADQRLLIRAADLLPCDAHAPATEMTANWRRNEDRFVVSIAVRWRCIYRSGSRRRGRGSGLCRLSCCRAARKQSNQREIAKEVFVHSKASFIHGNATSVNNKRFRAVAIS